MFLKTCGLFRRLFILFFKQKLFGLRDAHWIACTSSREFFRVLSVVVGWSGGSIFRVDHFFFQIVFALCDIFTAALITWKITSSVCLLLSFSLFKCPCDLVVAPKIFWSSFLKIIIEKTKAFWEDFWFRIRCFLLNSHLSFFGTLLL